MDNGYKIKNRDLFVDELLENFKVEKTFSGNKYKVEEEFPKTAGNRLKYFWKKMWLPLIVTLAVVVGATLIISYQVNKRNNSISLDVTTFEDLNLANLLSVVSDANKKYESEQKELERLQSEWETQVQENDLSRESELLTVDSLNLESEEEAELMKQEILAKYEKSLEELNTRFQEKIDAQKILVEEAKFALDDFQAQNEEAMEKARQSSVLTSQTLIQLQQQQLQNQYESELEGMHAQLSQVQEAGFERQQQALTSVAEKYQAQIGRLDPDLSQTDAGKISDSVKTDSMSRNYLSQVWKSKLDEKAGDEFKEALNVFEKRKADSKTMQDELQTAVAVEHRNSIPKFLTSLFRLNNQADNGFAQAAVEEVNAHIQKETELELHVTELEEQAVELNKEIEDGKLREQELTERNQLLEEQVVSSRKTSVVFEDALDALCDGDGIVLSAGDQSKVQAYVVKAKRQFVGDAAVFDGNNIVAIGKVTFVEATGECIFRPGSYVLGKRSDPYSISPYKAGEGEAAPFENKEVKAGARIVLLNALPEKSESDLDLKKWWPF